MSLPLYGAALAAAVLITLFAYVQLLYVEGLRLRARETPALELFKEKMEDRIGLKLEEGALVFSFLKHSLIVALTVDVFYIVQDAARSTPNQPGWALAAEALALPCIQILFYAHILPQVLYRRVSGVWLWPLIPVLRLIAVLCTPLVAALRVMKTLADLSGPDKPVEDKADTEQQIDALITAGKEEGIIAEGDRRLIESVVAFGAKTVREVMTPRNDILAISVEASLQELRDLAVRERYSRIPVFDGSIDNLVGFVHVRDMFELEARDRAARKVRAIMRRIKLVPETKPVDDVLRLMQDTREHMVVVIDEYGHTAGLATMEDLVEEIVGEIRDEHEPERDVTEEPGGSYLVSGNLDLDRLDEMLEFRPSEATASTTIGGLVTEWLGHLPTVGETVERDGVRLEVTASSDRRVSQVRVSRLAKPAEKEAHAK
ncbi:MAG: HlyC/CorC family transporter [Acidobacteria bacterium]|nr:HlyC/CorC family transporter [Acidobacteriota bacterium]